MSLRVTGDLSVTGEISANTLTPSDASVTNAKVSAASGSEIDADKLEHIHRYFTDFDDEFDATPAGSVEKIVYRARAAGNVREVGFLLTDTGTDVNIDFDCQKASAGSKTFSSILTGTPAVTITHGDTDNTASLGTISGSSLVAGDVLRLDMTVNTSTGAEGPLGWVEIDETPA